MNTFQKSQAEKILSCYSNVGDILEKALPVGTINKYGRQKQADGSWKYVGKGKGSVGSKSEEKHVTDSKLAEPEGLNEEVDKIEQTPKTKSSAKSLITDKDWGRMSSLILSGKDGNPNAITNKDKAIARFVAGERLNDTTELKLSDSERDPFPGSFFPKFGERALELGATKEEIQAAFNGAVVPTKHAEKLANSSGKKLNDSFVGAISKKILDAGFDIAFEKTNSNAITREGKAAMRNGRKWTIGYKAEVDLGNGKKAKLAFDAITDEGGGPTSYVISEYDSDKIFLNEMWWEPVGVRKFTADIVEALSEHKEG